VPKRANHNLPAVQEKRAEVVRLRAEGMTWDQIARLTGYSNGSAASKAWKAAVQQRPDLSVDLVRAQEAERIEFLWTATAELIRDPGPRSSAIGKVVTFPEGHPRAGEIVPENSIRLRAIDQYRKQSEYYARLTGAMLEGPAVVIDQRNEVLRLELNQYFAARGRPLVPPIPGVTCE
jgi:hypothetical protein